MTQSKDYQKGYAAGRKKVASEIDELKRLKMAVDEKKERVYMRCLEMTLKHCSGWRISGKAINNAEGYCRLAKIFADNAISEMDG